MRCRVGMKGAESFGEGGRCKDHSEPARRERSERLDNASEDHSEAPDSNGEGAFRVFVFSKLTHRKSFSEAPDSNGEGAFKLIPFSIPSNRLC